MLDLQVKRDSGRAHMRISRCGDLNTLSIEYLFVEDDDGGMPRSDASEDLTTMSE